MSAAATRVPAARRTPTPSPGTTWDNPDWVGGGHANRISRAGASPGGNLAKAQAGADAEAAYDHEASLLANGAARPGRSRTAGFASTPTGGGGVVHDVTGFVFAFMFWGWIVLPFITGGGPGGVRDVFRAKFFNKGPDGAPLLGHTTAAAGPATSLGPPSARVVGA